MKMSVVAVRDRAVDSFGNPFFVRHIGQAIREFSDEINRKVEGNNLAQHPEDFDLYALGEFDTDTGIFDTGVPRQIAIGKDVVTK